MVRKEKLEVVYFIKLPYTKYLPKDKKNEFNENVDRSNVKSKVEVIEIYSNYFLIFQPIEQISNKIN